MITRFDIEERVREWELREDVVEKDYVIGWVLWGIGRDPTLGKTWVFKGGTCLKKCYLETYRFSEDLDFTVLPGGPIHPDELAPVLASVLERVGDESGIDFNQRPPLFQGHSSGQYTEGRIYYVGPRETPIVASIRLDLSRSEKVVRPTVIRLVSHPYPDSFEEPATVRCYGPEEVFAEKVRAMGERGRPRDLYDIVNLYRRQDIDFDPREIHVVLVEKCQAKGVPVPTAQSVLSSERRAELESEWSNMLRHQLPALPPLDTFLRELPSLFAWLERGTPRPSLEPAPVGRTEDSSWAAPRTTQVWGARAPLETIRFAGTNHLCVELGYDGMLRLIEPYSLRRTHDGNLLLHANRVDSGEHRSYRVDRIESARVTDKPFTPRYLVEFSGRC